ncbi:MAG: bifunctional phosphoribosyl-AMP cyclohydrolase/phosphoribosyl-ATP diphosphatase HisIE [Xanthomonadales bacterium]|nr:bifunctional phosphoribosyl-AMP cyclohydrolase/phosphoribosyl-ATP diphosphatase HisIE [Xanthomonadales bacterium]
MTQQLAGDRRIDDLDWAKGDGLLPAIVQDADDGRVLMLGYMNAQALQQTLASGRVCFWSRSKQRLWTKGEQSGHWLTLVEARADCDADTLLLRALPAGPTCHLGTATCFGADDPGPALAFLADLGRVIESRRDAAPDSSYTARLFAAGTRRIAQKVGEEGVETALAAVAQDAPALLGEAADLLYHLQVLLADRGLGLLDVVAELRQRHGG